MIRVDITYNCAESENYQYIRSSTYIIVHMRNISNEGIHVVAPRMEHEHGVRHSQRVQSEPDAHRDRAENDMTRHQDTERAFEFPKPSQLP